MIKFSGITFDPNFKKRTQADFDKKQKYIDSEILRLSDPYVPMQTGMMKKSGISGTVVGSGKVKYIAPYAKPQYYTNAGCGKEGMNNTSGTKGLRGKFWFERMKADHKKEILKGLKKIK
ncbi:MAG: minor capsid protein [Ruminococcus sp.]|nr:minor capsid protein [Ruminococcus sp.]